MGILDELQTNKCTFCRDHKIKNGEYIDVEWRDNNCNGYWPKPYWETELDDDKIKAIVIGQDPTIENLRPIEYALEADKENSNLGSFLKEVFGMVVEKLKAWQYSLSGRRYELAVDSITIEEIKKIKNGSYRPNVSD